MSTGPTFVNGSNLCQRIQPSRSQHSERQTFVNGSNLCHWVQPIVSGSNRCNGPPARPPSREGLALPSWPSGPGRAGTGPKRTYSPKT